MNIIALIPVFSDTRKFKEVELAKNLFTKEDQVNRKLNYNSRRSTNKFAAPDASHHAYTVSQKCTKMVTDHRASPSHLVDDDFLL